MSFPLHRYLQKSVRPLLKTSKETKVKAHLRRAGGDGCIHCSDRYDPKIGSVCPCMTFLHNTSNAQLPVIGNKSAETLPIKHHLQYR